MQVVLLAAVLGLGAHRSEEEPSLLRAAREEERVAQLALEAARSKEFYLVADLGTGTLSIGIAGVTLATHRMESVQVGRPLSASREGDDDTLQELYSCRTPELRAPREILPGEPPSPDEPGKAALSRTVRLDCEPPLSLTLTRGSLLAGVRDRIRLPWDREAVRVRIRMPEEEADRLSPSLPRSFLLLISRIPPRPGAPSSTALH